MSMDSYIMTNDVTDTSNYIDQKVRDLCIVIDNHIYIVSMIIIGSYISDTGFLKYYGKVCIFNKEEKISRNIRTKIFKAYTKRVKKKLGKNYIVSINDGWYSTITCKERLKCQ